jgi:3-oxoadipate enol-lactonase
MARMTAGDIDFAYDITGSGPPVLMINGIGADRTAWGLQVPDLSKAFTVITFDNRDVGETRWRGEPSAYAVTDMAADAAALVQGLRLGPVHVVGASMGGAIAQEFAAAFPDLTTTVTTVCSWPKCDPWMIELMSQWDDVFRSQGAVAWARNSWLWVFTHRFYAQEGALESLLQSVADAPNPQSLEAYLRQSDAFKAHDATSRLGSITAPAHVICGEEDIYTPVRYSIDIANAIPGATLSVMPAVGHGMFWETTDAFNQLVAQFIREHA